LSELTKRVLVAFLAGPIFLGIIWYGGPAFLALMLITGLLIQKELIHLLDLQGFRTNSIVAYVSWVVIFVAMIFQEFLLPAVILVVVLQVVIDTLDKLYRDLTRLMSTLFTTAYPALGILTMVAIREIEMAPITGFGIILMLILMIWGNDTFAYFIGKNFGRRLLAQHLSPKKTWEGFIAGFFGTAAGLAITLYFIDFGTIGIKQLWPLILLISVFGPLGDLAASKMKRAASVKDTSTILPGHGGVLDRFDSLILTAPVMYLFFIYFIL
jgi:phosphatidate cytidylyltransferase